MSSIASTHTSPADSSRWLLLGVSGVVAIVVGALLIVQPVAAATLLAVALGIYLLATGALAVIGGIANRDETWGWQVAGGVCGAIAGIIVLLAPQFITLVTVFTLYFLLASAAIVLGAFEIMGGLMRSPREWSSVIVGALQIVLGILLFVYSLSGGGLQWFIPLMGLSAIASGVLLIGTGWQRRGPSAPVSGAV
jgi:uncharacterized membrane protein HdeD (DUF308 family)